MSRKAAIERIINRARVRVTREGRGSVRIQGSVVTYPDGRTFRAMYDEIFVKQIYRFSSPSDSPRIIDAGANIGLAVLYFKQLYPRSSITAFEPEPDLFAMLESNVRSRGITGVDLVRKAVWSSSGEVSFESEGINSARIAESSGSVRVPTVRLRDYLEIPVDFLKLDVEGAEWEVLRDSADLLPNVRNVFVESHSFAGKEQTFAPVIQLLTDSGFRLHFQESIPSPSPLHHRNIHRGMDALLNIFAYRE